MLVLTKGDSEIDEKWTEEPLQKNQKKIIMYDALGYVVTSYNYEMWALYEIVCKACLIKEMIVQKKGVLSNVKQYILRVMLIGFM